MDKVKVRQSQGIPDFLFHIYLRYIFNSLLTYFHNFVMKRGIPLIFISYILDAYSPILISRLSQFLYAKRELISCTRYQMRQRNVKSLPFLSSSFSLYFFFPSFFLIYFFIFLLFSILIFFLLSCTRY